MSWFVAFCGHSPYPSTTITPPRTEMSIIHEHYPIPFDGSGTMTMTPRQSSSSVLSGQRASLLLVPVHLTVPHAICCVWFGWTQIHLLLKATGFGYPAPWGKDLE
ncbi:hypothetical protein TNCV_3234221 [Trichonephila clavipes]|nr:hypothetical protein TNCV_3234221 [Trichonephila clavipes]